MAFSYTEVTATVSTSEYSILNNVAYASSTPSTNEGYIQVIVDAFAMASGDQFEFKIYETTKSAGTIRLAAYQCLSGAQTSLLIFPPIHVKYGWDVTAKKLAGTDRSIVASTRRTA